MIVNKDDRAGRQLECPVQHLAGRNGNASRITLGNQLVLNQTIAAIQIERAHSLRARIAQCGHEVSLERGPAGRDGHVEKPVAKTMLHQRTVRIEQFHDIRRRLVDDRRRAGAEHSAQRGKAQDQAFREFTRRFPYWREKSLQDLRIAPCAICRR